MGNGVRMTGGRVAIVLLNYRGAEKTLGCLASLQHLDYSDRQIIVVDNGSGDDSVERLQAAYPELHLVVSEENLGFSGGVNLGIRAAMENPQTRFVWLLNNDTTVDPKALNALIDAAQAHSKALIGSLLLYPDGRFQRIGNRLTPWLGKLKDCPQPASGSGPLVAVESLSGCSMLIPRQVFEAIGFFDERYFLYFEDNDFCMRAARVGFPSLACLHSRIFHEEGATTGKNRVVVTYYYQRNRLMLLKKKLSSFRFALVLAYTYFRLMRSACKAGQEPNRRHHEAFKAAVNDFRLGITGRCPHTFDT